MYVHQNPLVLKEVMKIMESDFTALKLIEVFIFITINPEIKKSRRAKQQFC